MGHNSSKQNSIFNIPNVYKYYVKFSNYASQYITYDKKLITETNTTQQYDRIPTNIRDAVWLKYHGNGKTGVCYCCGKKIKRYNAGWHCSHVISRNKGGTNTVENLRTCCGHCNLSMGNQNLYIYIQKKGLMGPGSKNIEHYINKNPSQKHDKRTNNWGKINS